MTTYRVPVQLDLFGEVAAQAERRERFAEALEVWRAGFERAQWEAEGLPAWKVSEGWLCPDPLCRRVEASAFTLQLNHGFDPNSAGDQPHHGRCQRLAHERPELRAVGRVCPVCSGERKPYAGTWPAMPCLVPAHAARTVPGDER